MIHLTHSKENLICHREEFNPEPPQSLSTGISAKRNIHEKLSSQRLDVL